MKALFLAALVALGATAASAHGHHRIRAHHHSVHRHVAAHGHAGPPRQLFGNPEQLPAENGSNATYWARDRKGEPGPIEGADSGGAYWQRERGGRQGPAEAAVASVGSDLVAAARRFLGQRNFTGFRGAWCKAATNIWLAKAGFSHGPSLRAIDGLRDGRRLSGPRPGALAIRAHHIAIVEAVLGNKVKLINGNFRNRVAESVEPASRFFAYVQPMRM